MTPEIFLGGKVKLFCGDCLEALPLMEENSIDSVVCDPPYHLTSIVKRFGKNGSAPAQFGTDGRFSRASAGFMGKQWDGGDIAQSVDLWWQVYRVLKPGAHLLAFGGTRTYHRMACAIEDAGFEIRDCIQWLYGSGFPKSHDVSKGIDRANGKHERDLVPFGKYVRECRESKGWSLRQLDDAMGTNTAASWWEGRKSGIQPPGTGQYQKLKIILGMDGRFDELIDWLEAEREKIGEGFSGIGTAIKNGEWSGLPGESFDITAPATDAARQWEGWGTALKPCAELVVMARKPLSERTVAANVLKWGTGAININACRVPSGQDHADKCASVVGLDSNRNGECYGEWKGARTDSYSSDGRWPGNVILTIPEDEYELRNFVSSEQKREIYKWMSENA